MAGSLTRDTAVFGFTSDENLTEKVGYAVEVESDNVRVFDGSGTPFGVVLDGEAATGKSTIATFAGASGTVKVKLAGTVAFGASLEVTSAGLFQTQSSGDVFAVAMEAGTADELIEAALVMYEP